MVFGKTIARITLLEALRSRVAWIAVAAMAIALVAAAFLSQVAMIEVAEIQIAIMAALLRFAAVFLIAAFCITSVIREINDKVLELYVSQSATRAEYYLGKFAGCAGVSLAVALAFAGSLAPFAPLQLVVTWCFSLVCELFIVAAVGLFCAISISQFTAAFAACAGFYVLARVMNAIQVIASSPLAEMGTWTDTALKWGIDAIALLMPALDQMTQTAWLLGQAPGLEVLATISAQTILYLVLIGAASLVDFYRKSF